jgi:hypothetical protein
MATKSDALITWIDFIAFLWIISSTMNGSVDVEPNVPAVS